MTIADPVDYRHPMLSDLGEKTELASLLSDTAAKPQKCCCDHMALIQSEDTRQIFYSLKGGVGIIQETWKQHCTQGCELISSLSHLSLNAAGPACSPGSIRHESSITDNIKHIFEAGWETESLVLTGWED